MRIVQFTELEWSEAVALLILLANGMPVPSEKIRPLLEKVRDEAVETEEDLSRAMMEAR